MVQQPCRLRDVKFDLLEQSLQLCLTRSPDVFSFTWHRVSCPCPPCAPTSLPPHRQAALRTCAGSIDRVAFVPYRSRGFAGYRNVEDQSASMLRVSSADSPRAAL